MSSRGAARGYMQQVDLTLQELCELNGIVKVVTARDVRSALIRNSMELNPGRRQP